MQGQWNPLTQREVGKWLDLPHFFGPQNKVTAVNGLDVSPNHYPDLINSHEVLGMSTSKFKFSELGLVWFNSDCI